MRRVVLDTETTGLEPAKGHRIVEIGLVEIVGRQRTGQVFHQYLNPQRDSEPGALQKHGLTSTFLSTFPTFSEIAPTFLDFVRSSELIIHNASFDLGFLDHELQLAGLDTRMGALCPQWIDTLHLARERHPGKRNSLDALCERYAIDNRHRTFHGALLDAELLADVYLAMTRGQDSLLVDELGISTPLTPPVASHSDPRPRLRVQLATPEELQQHNLQLDAIDSASQGACVWRQHRAG